MTHIEKCRLLGALLIGLSSFARTQAADLNEPGRPASEVKSARYYIHLNDEIARKEPVRDELPAVSTTDPRVKTDPRAWHKANVRSLVKKIEADYGVTALTLSSLIKPAFSAHITEGLAERLRRDPRVDRIEVLNEGGGGYATTWSDRCETSECVPWGKTAIGTDDTTTTSNIVYMVDGGSVVHTDLPGVISYNAVNPLYWNDYVTHATHVAGILAASIGNAGVRGINPGATIINVNKGKFADEIKLALEWTLQNAEDNHYHTVVNISSAGEWFASGIVHEIVSYMPLRLLVVAAAGNYRLDACTQANNPAKETDGILVVGGIDENGKWLAGPIVNPGPPPERVQNGTNWGPCVEVWAPAKRIKSTFTSPPVEFLTGTSMAAPHVAGFAARYGNMSTTSLQREQFVRSRLWATTHTDMGQTIVIPMYTQASAPAVPNRLPIASAHAYNSVPTAAYAIDDLYLDQSKVFNSGQPGGPNNWIEFDLGSTKTITGVRMIPEQFDGAVAIHNIYVGNSSPPTNLIATYQGNVSTIHPIYQPASGSGRYVRVQTSQSPNVAWREIEIYGF